MEKEVFERMVNEYNEGVERVEKAISFVNSPENSETLDALNRDLLIAQIKAMETYLGILAIRIGYNVPTEETEQ